MIEQENTYYSVKALLLSNVTAKDKIDAQNVSLIYDNLNDLFSCLIRTWKHVVIPNFFHEERVQDRQVPQTSKTTLKRICFPWSIPQL